MAKRDVAVQHNQSAHRFEVAIDDAMAVADYELNDGTMVFTHTNVPDQFEGQGIASQLARTGLDHARSAGYRVRADCPFISSYIARHPEYHDLDEQR